MVLGISSIDEIIFEAKSGRIFILVDDENRENEGDLIIPAEKCNSEIVNFMSKYGRGLICLAMSGEKIDKLGLKMMVDENESKLETPFTVSIGAKNGITTGISAFDRAKTVEVAINPNSTRANLSVPGHIFPLKAKANGVLERAGHTEASVDIARLAGFDSSAVICEIMNDDGSMARMNDLVKFAKIHDLKIGTIADLIKYRKKNGI